MGYAIKVILHAPPPDSPLLDDFVESCRRDRVERIFVIGDKCELIHDIIDEIIVGNGSDTSRFIVTTWHEGEMLENVLELASASSPVDGEVQQIAL